MKRLLLLILFTPLITFSQIYFNGVIVDSQNIPIQFASISINQTANGTHTNEKGIFYFDSIKPTDTLKISCIGYKNRAICVKDIKDQITLNSNSINIDEVIINRKNKPFTIGYYKMGSFIPYTYFSNLKSKIATFIPYQSSPAVIEQILLPITNINDTTELKIFLYEASEDGSPGKEIYSKLLKSNEIKNKIDISDEHIQMPLEGVFIAAEWLSEQFIKDLDNTKEVLGPAFRLKMTKPMDTNYTYMYWKSEWRLKWNPPNEQYRNVRFGLELKPL